MFGLLSYLDLLQPIAAPANYRGIPNQTFLERRAAARLVYYGMQYVIFMAKWSDSKKFILKALGKKYVCGSVQTQVI
jgi:hypothetical protein